MFSVEVALSERPTVVQAEPFHFSRYKSKSAPEGPVKFPLCVPLIVD